MLKRVHRWLGFHATRCVLFACMIGVVVQTQQQQTLPLDAQRARALQAILAILALKEAIAVRDLEAVDADIADMTVQEENEECYQPPQRWCHIDDLENDEVARVHTRFTKAELRQIYNLFEIPTDPDGKIRIHYGNTGNRWYVFGPEEIFLYSMIKGAEGHTHVGMAKDVFGGTDGGWRWGYAYKWLCEYLVSMWVLSHCELSFIISLQILTSLF